MNVSNLLRQYKQKHPIREPASPKHSETAVLAQALFDQNGRIIFDANNPNSGQNVRLQSTATNITLTDDVTTQLTELVVPILANERLLIELSLDINDEGAGDGNGGSYTLAAVIPGGATIISVVGATCIGEAIAFYSLPVSLGEPGHSQEQIPMNASIRVNNGALAGNVTFTIERQDGSFNGIVLGGSSVSIKVV